MKTSTTHKRHQSGSIVLNVFAILLTFMPFVSMSMWTYQQFFSDNRRVVALSEVHGGKNPRLFDEPLISITFDDGWETIYADAAPLMSKYDVVSTQYILPGVFSEPEYISVNQVKSLKKAGHEITSHTMTHRKLTDISQADAAWELNTSYATLKQRGLLTDSDKPNFAAPNGAVNTSVNAEIRSIYGSSRNVMGDLGKDVSDNDMNVRGKFDRYNIIGYTVGQYTTDDQLLAAFNYAKAHNAWFVPIYHQIDDSGEQYSVSRETFEHHLKLYKTAGIKIATVKSVLDNYKER